MVLDRVFDSYHQTDPFQLDYEMKIIIAFKFTTVGWLIGSRGVVKTP